MGRFILLLIVFISSTIYLSLAQNTYYFDVNKIGLPINNRGVLADVLISGNEQGGRLIDNGGLFLYSGGFLLSGKSNGFMWSNGVASASRIEDYQEGNVDSLPTNPLNKLYILDYSAGSFNQQWIDWVGAVSLGADFYDGDGDGIYNPADLNSNGFWDPNEDRPDLIGDLTAWCVYNDGVPATLRRFNDVNPQGIEIHQTIFGYIVQNLGYVVFVRYRILNTGKETDFIDSVYFSIWADSDIGEVNDALYDNLAGADISHNAGYIYNNGPSIDPHWGVSPPAHFIRLLQGPVSYIPNETFIDNNSNNVFDPGIDIPLDTAYNYRGKYLGIKSITGAKNLSSTSYNHYMQGHLTHGDPINRLEARNYMLGFDRNGDLVDPCNWTYGSVLGGVDCSTVNPLFMYSGNPVTQTGWINSSENDQRQSLNTGPFQLKAGEPVDIIMAHIVGRGNSHLNSITTARSISDYTRYFYNSNFGQVAVDVKDGTSEPVTDYRLFQNYPNPFNPETTIKFSMHESGLISLKVYDILGREVAVLVNDEMSSGTYEINFNAETFSSGIYFYKLVVNDYIFIKKMMLVK